MSRPETRTADVTLRKWGCIRTWIVGFYLNGTRICEAKRETRAEARQVANRYIETGMIPLN